MAAQNGKATYQGVPIVVKSCRTRCQSEYSFVWETLGIRRVVVVPVYLVALDLGDLLLDLLVGSGSNRLLDSLSAFGMADSE